MNDENEVDRIYTRKETAQRLRVSVRTLARRNKPRNCRRASGCRIAFMAIGRAQSRTISTPARLSVCRNKKCPATKDGAKGYAHEIDSDVRVAAQRLSAVTRHSKGRIGGPFVPLIKDTMKTEAWKALSHGARSLYGALKGRYNSKLQNSVYLAGRDATKELGSFSRRDNVRRWFRELEYYGFIRMVRLAHHGLNGHGRAPHYRLTEEWYNGQAPTRDYLNWDGVIFREQKSPAHYQTKNRSRGPYAGATLARTLRPLIDPIPSEAENSGPPAGAMREEHAGPYAEAITSLTTALAASLPPDSPLWPEEAYLASVVRLCGDRVLADG